MKSDLWYFLLFCFQVEVLTGEIKDSAKSEMFTFRDGGVQILCKFSDTVWQFKMELRKGTEVLCDLTKTKESGNTVPTKHPKFCQSELSDDGVSFFLNNLDSSHASYYTCQLSIFDPPPFQEKNISREYLNVYESQTCCQLKFWLPIGCAAFVGVYIFGCVFLCWLTKKKYRSSVHDPNSEYMFMAAVNTAKKPGFTGTTHNLELCGTQA
ncbi:inducible T-cell costimulator [Enhydra lutris kenyoni]|uniref:Inducible T-cell costimulator n=1 Tax=Enhydra lutris kenyoni TaxID=391180 RepID=A0A2Y9IXW1_ENHLU|nr:inducible T-cell costimulator [Enhydra lutris kenyoni]XP_032715884.1 inducible T-cell costimulator [Lontra canadensis]